MIYLLLLIEDTDDPVGVGLLLFFFFLVYYYYYFVIWEVRDQIWIIWKREQVNDKVGFVRLDEDVVTNISATCECCEASRLPCEC